MKKKSNLKYIPVFMILVLLAIGYMLTLFRSNEKNKEIISEDPYKLKLTPEQYYVLREGGTDIPFTHLDMLNNHEKGTYVTADCGEPVFRSEQKFDSGTGWPSFWAPIDDGAVELREDNSFGTKRIEVLGKKCGGHLGHVFDDGPEPTGKRYCINASALKFIPDEK